MNALALILTAACLLSLSGVPALFGSRQAPAGQRCAAGLMLLGSGLGLCGVGLALCAANAVAIDAAWLLPVGRFAAKVDVLAAIFLVPVFVVPALGAIYGLGYWKQSEHPESGRKLCLFYGLLAGSMALVVIAADAVLFLIAWEIMALAAYFAATAEDDDPTVQRAGWVYLIATHLGTLCLFALFALLRLAAGSTALQPVAGGAMPPALLGAIFVLALIGFGCKAGLMPLHVWLPAAHANAPSHVSAVLSGVMLKMGIYGIARIVSLLDPLPVWCGELLLGLGALSGVLGIAFAIGQRDVKRLLAYSSIENIGIITMGLGLALLGRSFGRGDWTVLGLGGALLHVWNHALFKPLLFLNAGTVIHAAGTREIDRMGGLARRMPRTAFMFLLGAAAICALPPLNGFAGEWLLYLGFFSASGAAADAACLPAALGVSALALTGALAAACFVKLFGAVFLGEPRGSAGAAAHDPARSMLLPPAALALGCVALGLAPWLVAPLLERATRNCFAAAAVSGETYPAGLPLLALAPLNWISLLGLVLIAGVSAGGTLLLRAMKSRSVSGTVTWDCGYAAPAARMQYTGSSFGQALVALFKWALRPKTTAPRIAGIFPQPSVFDSDVPDTVLDRVVLPAFRHAEQWLHCLRIFQQGSIQFYISYYLAAVLVLLFWGSYGY